jgi:hypothetical protein
LDAVARVLVVTLCMVLPTVLVLDLVFAFCFPLIFPIALIGNSMQYQNDLPRLIETMSAVSMTQKLLFARRHDLAQDFANWDWHV